MKGTSMNEKLHIEICYFSGTGNTEIVAKLMAEAFRRQGADAGLRRMEDVLNGRVAMPADDRAMLGIGYPVHGFGAPRMVDDFVRRLPDAKGTRAFVFMTASDEFCLNSAASETIARCLRKKGYDVFHESMVPMPCNFALKYPDSLMKQLCIRAVEETAGLAKEIVTEKPRKFHEGWITLLMARWLNAFESYGTRYFGKDLKVSKACTLCGKCVRDCPTLNITRDGDTIKFGWNCTMCFRCIYGCPVNAIMPVWEKCFIVKNGYDINKINNGPEINDGFIENSTSWLYKRLKAYVLRGSRRV
ncbi:MAG: hypothetical protein C0404_08555 [Verrucomicrobia bacterium]|nr:hypothetical protein [Verrucomicrobiota bacterium]